MRQSGEPSDELRESRSRSQDEEVENLIDALHLNLLHLTEDRQRLQLQVNKESCRARLILARVRMHQGCQRTSAEALLPRGRPYKALSRVLEESSYWGKVFKIMRLPVDPLLGYFRPLTKIFGSLVSQSLRIANRHWDHCLDLVVECANIQRELQATINSIEKLRWSQDQRLSL
ncbi:uncharacterized protein LOC108034446 [Drosophila biarmipes]|uniref:uncharacterized protein LOC108034446 n=1 Tax=Drosophila biarmipes TaxID=125945 RepID=UPI0007E724E2|nr:uncharacterized protein LOC108034446 [Drosophila biarmipes]